MKKIIFAVAVLGIASLSSLSAAPCNNGTLASLSALGIGVPCTVGATDQYNLSNFQMFDNALATNFPQGNIRPEDLFVTFATVGNGFSISYSLAPGARAQYFTIENPAGTSLDQAIEWKNNVRIDGLGGAATSIQSISMTANGFFGDASLTLNKRVHDGSSQFIEAAGVCQGCALPVSSVTITGNYGNAVIPNDVINFNALGASTLTSGLSSYTNTFQPGSGDIPEPMTFVLMGAGLVGIAALRRRKS